MTLSSEDAKDLTKYFASAGHAQRSIQGPILDRMLLMSVRHKPASGPITARPTAEVRDIARVEPDLTNVEVLGRVSSRLNAISPRFREVLEAFYGDDGACCAARSKTYGRLVSLFRFTAAGRHMVKLARKESELKVSPTQVIQNAVSKQEIQAAQGVQSVSIGSAYTQAEALKDAAEAAYSDASARHNGQRNKPQNQRRSTLESE